MSPTACGVALAGGTLWASLFQLSSTQELNESVPLDLEKALKRAIAMIIGRLKAYGKRWRDWVQAGRHHRQPRSIGRKHRNKKLLKQDEDGEYEIHSALWRLADDLNLTHS